jgi:protein-S-isoprenylcysteine O-methyltransferase Ste14
MLFALRIGAEERMMLETFGEEYAAYMTKTKLLVPESGDVRSRCVLPVTNQRRSM